MYFLSFHTFAQKSRPISGLRIRKIFLKVYFRYKCTQCDTHKVSLETAAFLYMNYTCYGRRRQEQGGPIGPRVTLYHMIKSRELKRNYQKEKSFIAVSMAFDVGWINSFFSFLYEMNQYQKRVKFLILHLKGQPTVIKCILQQLYVTL